MLSNDYLQALSARLAGLFPAASAMRKDLEANIHELLQKSFARLNLVTREEFDTQLSVLKRAEQTIDELERKIARLESQCQTGRPPLKKDDQTSGN